MLIRRYKADDHDGVVALWKECFKYPAPHNDPELSISRKAALDDGLFFIAVPDIEVVGTVMAGWDGHRCWIYSLAVHPLLRGQGIGGKLVDRAVDELKERDCPKVNLQVMPDNTRVIGFYEKLGFLVEERVSMGRKLYLTSNP